MIPRLRWAIVKAVWWTAAAGFALGVYGQAMPRFY